MRRIRGAGMAAALALTAGCQLKPEFDLGYRVAEVGGPPASTGTLAVQPFEDARPPLLRQANGRLFLLYIPLLPYVSVRNVRVDEIVIEHSRRGGSTFSIISPRVQPLADPQAAHYTNSFADAIAVDLEKSAVFAAATLGGSGDYELTGTLRNSEYRVSTTSYALGMAGVLLWILPIPMEKVSGEVALDLRLTDTRSGEVVWEGPLEGEVSSFRTMYGTSAMIHGTGWGAFTFQVQKGIDERANPRSVFWWDFAALKEAMDSVRPQIVEAVRHHEAFLD